MNVLYRVSLWVLLVTVIFANNTVLANSTFIKEVSEETQLRPPIQVGLWFTAPQIQQLEQDSILTQLLIRSEAKILVWEGVPGSLTREIMTKGVFTWIPRYPGGLFASLNSTTDWEKWSQDLELFNNTWLKEISRVEEERVLMDANLKRGLIIATYPFFRSGETELQLNSELKNHRDWSVVIRPDQQNSLSNDLQAIITCLNPSPSDCFGNRIDGSRSATEKELLSNLGRYTQLLYDKEGGELYLNGIQWLNILKNHPDFSAVISDLSLGRPTVFPNLSESSTRDVNWGDTFHHVLLVLVLLSYFLLFRSAGYYMQRLYRYFLSFGYAQMEISSRRDQSLFESWVYLLVGSVLSGTLLQSFLQFNITPIGIGALNEFIPLFSVQMGDSSGPFLFTFLFSFLLIILSTSWIWISYAKQISMTLVLKVITWPLHLLLIPVLLEVFMLEPGSNSTLPYWTSGGSLLFFFATLIIGNLNLYQVPRRKNSIWLYVGILGWIVVFGGVTTLIYTLTPLSDWIRFALSL